MWQSQPAYDGAAEVVAVGQEKATEAKLLVARLSWQLGPLYTTGYLKHSLQELSKESLYSVRVERCAQVQTRAGLTKAHDDLFISGCIN